MMDQARLTALERTLLGLVLALSLFLRLAALDAFLTTDEALWRQRSLNFAAALARRDWPATYQAGHPGVVTMWIGTAASRLQALQRPLATGTAELRQLMPAPAPAPGTGIPPLTLGARRLLALVTWLGVLAAYTLLRRLFDAHTALVGTVLVALDPFFLAHSRFHHLDGLLATFVTISALALLVYRYRGRGLRFLLASAAAGALAMANKSPGVLLVPWAALTLLVPALWEPRQGRGKALLRAAGELALWALALGPVLVAVWPALWVDPLGVAQKVLGVAKHFAETPHEFSNYFWFAARPDPGPAFYPVAWAFRASPLAMAGLVALALAWRKLQQRAAVAMVLAFVLLYGVAMTVGEKKFDRYLLPVFPLLDVLAGVGGVVLLRRWRAHLLAGWQAYVPGLLAAALTVGQFALVWPTRPYYISYYNPLLGGPRMASRLLLVGWGEGLDQAAAYLNGLPDAEQARVITWNHQDFVPFFKGSSVGGAEAVTFAEADYYVFYLNEVQGRSDSAALKYFMAQGVPEHVVTLGGLDYAWVFRNTYYDAAAQELLARIDREGDRARDLVLFDLDAAAARHYQGRLPVSTLTGWGRDDYVRTELQRLTAGRERVWHVVYTQGTPDISRQVRRVLAASGTHGEKFAVGGLRAERYDLAPGARFVPAAPPATLEARFGDCIRLLGYEVSPQALAPGATLHLTLYWQATAPVGADYTVFTHLRGPEGQVLAQADSAPQGGLRPTTAWRPGEVILDEYELTVPADGPPGAYTVAAGLFDPITMERLPAVDAQGGALLERAAAVQGLQVIP